MASKRKTKKAASRKKPQTVEACKRAGGRPVKFKGMKRGKIACFGAGKKSGRAAAKTETACRRAGGTPVRFKGMKKGEVACFGKKKTTKRRKSR